MSKESRKKLAGLSFTEKVRLLEKLRARSLAFAASRRRMVKTKVRNFGLDELRLVKDTQ